MGETMHAEDLLAEGDHALVALDGPVAELPPRAGMADRLRVMLGEEKLPRKVERTDDPFVVLAHAATIGPATERAVYSQLCRLEAEMVAAARLAPGVGAAFARLASAGTRVTVIANLAPEAIRAFLVVHGLDEHVSRLAGHTSPGQGPWAHAFPGEGCLFVGCTDDDLAAARAAGLDILRYRRPADSESWFEALKV